MKDKISGNEFPTFAKVDEEMDERNEGVLA